MCVFVFVCMLERGLGGVRGGETGLDTKRGVREGCQILATIEEPLFW